MSEKVLKLSKKKMVKVETREMTTKDKKDLACWVGQKILESQEKMEKTLEEMSDICKQACKK